MDYRNFLNFILSAIIIYLFMTSIPTLYHVFTAFSALFIGTKLAQWLMTITRKHILWEAVSSQNKAVLITGCDSGFGNALARKLDKLGYTVYATCLNPNGEGAKNLSKECSNHLNVLQMDVTDDRSIQQVKKHVDINLGQNVLWTVVNNAGIAHYSEIDWTSVDEIQQVYDVNAAGTLRVTKCFLSLLKKSQGRIVNVTSLGGRYCSPGFVGYCMSKSASISLTTGLRVELAKWGVKAISIEPFFYATQISTSQVLTDITNKAWNSAPKEIHEEYGEDYIKYFQKTIDIIQYFRRPSINEVTDCLVDAITAKEPLSTYSPGTGILRLPLEVIPSCIMEFVQRTTFNKRLKPLVLRSKDNVKKYK